MMKTMDEIDLDYSRAVRAAELVEGAARDIDRLAAHDFEGCLKQIAAGWKGELSEAFLEKGSQILKNMENSAVLLRKTAGTIRRTANRTRDADLEAGNIALSSGGV